MRKLLTRPLLFTPLLRGAQRLRPLLPAALRARIPVRVRTSPYHSGAPAARVMLLLDGCVQPALAPQINRAAQAVLHALGIDLITARNAGCCGALSHHLDAGAEARAFMRRNIDAWWPHIEQGAEAIVVTASGCAPMVKDYGRLLADDPDYAARATRVSALARDLSEVVAAERPGTVLAPAPAARIAFHAPCTLQHGQRLTGVVEGLLGDLGYHLTPVADGHLCCGSAGTYSILQGKLAAQLRDNKLAALQQGAPDTIATANIGCHLHMAGHAGVPVVHWIELLSTLLPETRP